jgi:hypothetical protein
MAKSVPEEAAATPKGLPSSARHETETAVHSPTETHQTEAAEDASHKEAAREKNTGSGSEGGKR